MEGYDPHFRAHVFVESYGDWTVALDSIVIIDYNQIVKLQVACERSCCTVSVAKRRFENRILLTF